MPWIARDSGANAPYRIFGKKPVRAKYVNYDGDVIEEFTWTLLRKPYVNKEPKKITYQPLSNDENTTMAEADSPIYLEPGEGPIKVNLVLKDVPCQRSFEGAGI